MRDEEVPAVCGAQAGWGGRRACGVARGCVRGGGVPHLRCLCGELWLSLVCALPGGLCELRYRLVQRASLLELEVLE